MALALQVIVTWDDDDIYSPARVWTQVAPILSGAANATVLTFNLYGWVDSRTVHFFRQPNHTGHYHCGTLAFKRAV